MRSQLQSKKNQTAGHIKYQAKRKKSKNVSEDVIQYPRWKHPGGKLRELGPKALTNEELLSILISTGYKGKSAIEVAEELLEKHGSLESLSNIPLAKLLEIKGLGDVKIIRIAAALEIARRTTEEILNRYDKKN
jgi:DNA repair protein RadC